MCASPAPEVYVSPPPAHTNTKKSFHFRAHVHHPYRYGYSHSYGHQCDETARRTVRVHHTAGAKCSETTAPVPHHIAPGSREKAATTNRPALSSRRICCHLPAVRHLHLYVTRHSRGTGPIAELGFKAIDVK